MKKSKTINGMHPQIFNIVNQLSVVKLMNKTKGHYVPFLKANISLIDIETVMLYSMNIECRMELKK